MSPPNFKSWIANLKFWFLVNFFLDSGIRAIPLKNTPPLVDDLGQTRGVFLTSQFGPDRTPPQINKKQCFVALARRRRKILVFLDHYLSISIAKTRFLCSFLAKNAQKIHRMSQNALYKTLYRPLKGQKWSKFYREIRHKVT